MAKSPFKQLDDQVKSQHKYLESLSPKQRRSLYIQMRDAENKTAQQSAIFLAIIGLVISVITVLLWLNKYKMSLLSNLGVIGGAVLAIFGLQYIISHRSQRNLKFQSNDFTDDDLIAQFREHEKVNRRAAEKWDGSQYLVFVFGVILFLLLSLPPIQDFTFTLLGSLISIFLVGSSIYTFVQKKNKGIR